MCLTRPLCQIWHKRSSQGHITSNNLTKVFYGAKNDNFIRNSRIIFENCLNYRTKESGQKFQSGRYGPKFLRAWPLRHEISARQGSKTLYCVDPVDFHTNFYQTLSKSFIHLFQIERIIGRRIRLLALLFTNLNFFQSIGDF